MICGNSKATVCWSGMALGTLTGSPQKVCRSHFCSCSFTNAGPLANSRFHHQPDPAHRPNNKLEAAYYKADAAIQIVDLLAAA